MSIRSVMGHQRDKTSKDAHYTYLQQWKEVTQKGTDAKDMDGKKFENLDITGAT